MADPFVAEIRLFPFAFAPTGWALCNGQVLPISQNTALFSLLGTVYGGDGRSTFALPDLRGATPLGPGQGPGLSLRTQGETGGQATVALTPGEMPAHTHTVRGASGLGDQNSPQNAVWGSAAWGRRRDRTYATGAPDVPMHPAALAPAGGGLPHTNMPPYLVVTFCIALQGVFPQRP
ncbi:phage tail protein [Modestobacter sp. Leaf380]|uniref:phage tail protein n=1 Tax=Modestobacter sp. Leaf380 TaxID=1736356 RepID=UPI0007023C39|nr:tail fiber protein [Modestobacter sp. Leaf380]KQS69083.1 phage tail protein [Modestobacter sp. Leaf380]